jgi:UDP-N-acetylmuramoyl-tripeptide--D-alanyl-D-alanine ligase
VSEVRLTLGWITGAVGGRLHGADPAIEVREITTDSRALQAGDLFVALRGPRFDGHAFVAEVHSRGAVAALVDAGAIVSGAVEGQSSRTERGPESTAVPAGRDAAGFGLIEVADTLAALQALATAVRVAAGTRVVAITGSAGKTTTKETVAAFLATQLRVVKNKGNLNNHIGLPLSLLQLRSGPDAAVMELGMNHAGEIRTLMRIARPDVRVWTNVGDAHLGFFSSPDAIADAKAEILEDASPESVLICNADDPRVMARSRSFVGRTITFGTAVGATVRAVDVEDRGLDGMRARVATPSGHVRIDTPLIGRGNLSNLLAAVAVADDFGIPLPTIAEQAASLHAADRRGAVRRLARGVVLIDDSYNSSPAALRVALEVVAHDSRATGKVAVLGEMLELGEHSAALHRACGAVAASAGLRQLFTVGGAPAGTMAAAAVAGGMPAAAVRHLDTSAAAAEAVAVTVRAGDLVLVKGSRGIRTDLVADRLVAEFS